jgi:hypothetical protein
MAAPVTEIVDTPRTLFYTQKIRTGNMTGEEADAARTFLYN